MSKLQIIAHRGLLEGPDSENENKPDQIDYSISLGYSCEIDLWLIDDQLWLGHDEPTYRTNIKWLSERPLWIHAKNLEAFRYLTNHSNLVYFWHQNDDYTLTSNRFIWTQPGKPLTDRSIMVMPEWTDPTFEKIKSINCYGICTDYVLTIQKIIS